MCASRTLLHPGGTAGRIRADYIAGCDGFHGISRDAIPASVKRVFEREYPFGWVGILVAAAPSTELVTYAWHERGIRALQYAQSRDHAGSTCSATTISSILCVARAPHLGRAARPAWRFQAGRSTKAPSLNSGITGMRSFVVEPMQYRAALPRRRCGPHRPAHGRQGTQPRTRRRARCWPRRLATHFRTGSTSGLEAYSTTCLRRAWRAQELLVVDDRAAAPIPR